MAEAILGLVKAPGGGLYVHCYFGVLPTSIGLQFPDWEGNEGNRHTKDCHYLNNLIGIIASSLAIALEKSGRNQGVEIKEIK